MFKHQLWTRGSSPQLFKLCPGKFKEVRIASRSDCISSRLLSENWTWFKIGQKSWNKKKTKKQKKIDEAPHTWKPRARALVAYIIKRESRAIQSSSTTTPNFNTELRARLSDELWAREKRWKRVQGPARNLSNKHVYRNDDDDSPNIHQAEAEYLSLLWLSSAQCQLRLRALNAVSCLGLCYSVCNEPRIFVCL